MSKTLIGTMSNRGVEAAKGRGKIAVPPLKKENWET